VAAIGASTEAALQAEGIKVDIVPSLEQGRFDTETLLKHEALQDLEHNKVVIVRGHGGRPDLGDALVKRNAQVDYFECYERRLPARASGAIDLKAEAVQLIVCTSNEMLKNLVDLIEVEQRARLMDLQLVVVSQRAKEFAQELGFHKPALVTKNASQEAIVETLMQYAGRK
jgi:uroporphyrinogen-III synthase